MNRLTLILIICAFVFILVSISAIIFLIIKIFMVGGEALEFPKSKSKE